MPISSAMRFTSPIVSSSFAMVASCAHARPVAGSFDECYKRTVIRGIDMPEHTTACDPCDTPWMHNPEAVLRG